MYDTAWHEPLSSGVTNLGHEIPDPSDFAVSSYVRHLTRKALEPPWRALGTVRGGEVSRAHTYHCVFQMGAEHELA